MSRPVYSKQLAVVSLTAPAVQIIDLPDAQTYVIRDIQAWLQTDATAGATATISVDDTFFYLFSLPSSTTDTDHQEVRWVAPGPLSLAIGVVGGAATLNMWISGYELTP